MSEMQNKRAAKIFISYTSCDQVFAEHLATDLRKLGLPVWIAAWEMRVGGSIVEQIESGLEQSAWMIAILSPEAMKSEWVLKELRSAHVREANDANLYLLPVLLRDTMLPPFLRDKFYADFRNSYEDGFRLITDRLLDKYREQKGESWLVVKWPAYPGKNKDEFENDSLIRIGEGQLYSICKGDRRRLLSALNQLTMPSIIAYKTGQLPEKSRSPIERNLYPPEGHCWFGASGRLFLNYFGGYVNGDYDWFGLPIAGSVYGEIEDQTIQLQWDWKFSSEKGLAIFHADIPNVLHGGWWMDYEDISFDDVISGKRVPSNSWEFVLMPGLQMEMSTDDR